MKGAFMLNSKYILKEKMAGASSFCPSCFMLLKLLVDIEFVFRMIFVFFKMLKTGNLR